VEKLFYFFVEAIFSFAGLIRSPKSPTDFEKKNDKAAKAQQRSIELKGR
jgi:hypothetical protein